MTFSAVDSDGPLPVTLGIALTPGVCDGSLSFAATTGDTLFNTDANNGEYVCARAHDGVDYSYLRSANPFNIIFDTTAPTVEITGLPGTYSGTAPIGLTVTFSEDVTGFVEADITIAGATVTDFTGGPAAYTVEITPTGTGDISVSVGAAVAEDLASNDNEASAEVTSGNTPPNVAPVLSFQDDVDLVALAAVGDRIVFSATDSDGPSAVTLGLTVTSDVCDGSLSFNPTTGNTVVHSPTSNDLYLCVSAFDGVDYS